MGPTSIFLTIMGGVIGAAALAGVVGAVVEIKGDERKRRRLLPKEKLERFEKEIATFIADHDMMNTLQNTELLEHLAKAMGVEILYGDIPDDLYAHKDIATYSVDGHMRIHVRWDLKKDYARQLIAYELAKLIQYDDIMHGRDTLLSNVEYADQEYIYKYVARTLLLPMNLFIVDLKSRGFFTKKTNREHLIEWIADKYRVKQGIVIDRLFDYETLEQ